MVAAGKRKAEHRNPNDPARFVGKLAVTQEGEKAKNPLLSGRGKDRTGGKI